MSCIYEVAVRLLALDGTTELVDLSDGAAGYGIVSAGPGDESWERGITESPFVNGEFETWAKDAATTYVVVLTVTGTSWPQVEHRRLALRDAYRSASHYLLEETLEGVTTRYRARRPDVTVEPAKAEHFLRNEREITLTFPVQPNPTVTGVTA